MGKGCRCGPFLLWFVCRFNIRKISMTRVHVQLIGIYSVEENPDVFLIELFVNKNPSQLDVGKFTQRVDELPESSWQAPFFEKYLDPKGEKIIGDDFKIPETLEDITRLTFFIYYLDITKPLLTPFGEIPLIEVTDAPERIKKIIQYEDPE